MPHPPNTLNLVADIGGTNTRVALADGRRVLPETIQRYANRDFNGLEAVLRQYVAEQGDVDTKAACVAVAGPVRDGRASMTNLDWTMDEATLARATSAERVAILNDLQAQGHALGVIDPSKIKSLLGTEQPDNTSTKLVVGIGTGFNAAPVFETDHGRLVTPSEAGHANLPIRTDQELQLCHYVSSAHGFPAVEDVLSGRGLERVYGFLTRNDPQAREKSSAEIMEACRAASDPVATEAARIFTRILGTVCGNLSLIYLPFGGVYLIGGVARAFSDHLDAFGFGEAFRDKGRFAGFMGNFSVSIIKDDYAAIHGCAAFLSPQTAD